MRKIFTSIILSLFAVLTLQAQETVTKMVITLNDSTQTKVSISDVKNITFAQELNVNAVDLGLPSGTLWADRNIGADYPEQYGYYLSWGETEEKTSYTQNTYLYYTTADGYKDLGIDIAGTDKDAAHMLWGDKWVTPDSIQAKELVDNCTWTWTTLYGKTGYEVKGKNGNSIFLPAAGIKMSKRIGFEETGGKYMCSDCDTNRPMGNYYLNFFDDEVGSVSYTMRWYGFSVRPVIKKQAN